MMTIPSKTIGDRTYVHIDVLSSLDATAVERVANACQLAQVAPGEQFNLVRIDNDGPCVALLHYPDFFEDPFPALRVSWLVDLDRGSVSYRTYADSQNPPVLHRKELLLPANHPRRKEFLELTEAAETIGLFDQPTRIGYRCQWLQLVEEKGYRLVGHELVPIGNGDTAVCGREELLSTGWLVARQRTALVRYAFSAPLQTLARHGFLDGRRTVFDYGCGRGDDLRGLLENGIAASGWDPYYAPSNPINAADIVNLGFVVNVIEDVDERIDALTKAYSLAEQLLVVSVMLANQNAVQGHRFRDGVLTQRGTFQKYYTQAEIKTFVQLVLEEEPIPVAPGVLYVFRKKDEEQCFLVDRFRSRRNLMHSPSISRREPSTSHHRDRDAAKYSRYQDQLDRLWERWVVLGRKPEKSEIEDVARLTEGFGTLVSYDSDLYIF